MSDIDSQDAEIIVLGDEVEKFKASKLGKYLVNYAAHEADEALSQLATVSPTNTTEIMRLQGIVQRSRNFNQWLEEALQAAQLAYQRYLDEQGE